MKYNSYIFIILGLVIWISGKFFIEKSIGLTNWSQQLRASLVPSEEQEFDQEISRYYFDPFHLQMSPYGRTVALSMSGQLNKMWHFGGSHDTWKDVPQEAAPYEKAFLTVKNFEILRYKRTNRAPQTKAMEQFIRQQTEKLVRSGYLLDPVNYEQFQAYGFFLGELTSRDVNSRSFKALSNFTYEFSKTRGDVISRMSGMSATVNTLALMQLRNLTDVNFYSIEELVDATNIADQAVTNFVPIFKQFLSGEGAQNCHPEFLKVLANYATETVILQNRNREALLNKGLKLKLGDIPEERFYDLLESNIK